MSEELRILLLEDVDTDAELVEYTLRKAKLAFSLERVETKEDFVKGLDEFRPHVILADYHLPSFDGLSALGIAEEKSPEIPFIFVSGSIGEEFAVETLKRGATDYILKDRLSRLAPAVRRALAEAEEHVKRREAEEALRQERDKVQEYLDIAGVIVLVIGADRKVQLVNRKGCELLGYDQEEIIGSDWFDNYLLEEDREPAGTFFQAAIDGEREQPAEAENYVLTRTGESRLMAWHNTLLRDDSGKIIGTLSSGEDITDQRQAEEALRASEERFAVAFRSNPNAVGINYLETGRYVDVNDSFVSMYGYDRDEVIGRTPLELRLWEEPEQRDELMRTLREQGVVRDFQFAFRPKSGELGTARLSAGLIELGGEPCILAVTNDITEQIRLEEQLRQAQRMEAVGQLTGGIAHDFNNLLTAILGFTHLMQAQLSPEDPLYEFTERILYSGERAASLTSQLLAFSRKQIIQPRVLDLNTVIPDMDEMLQRIIGEDVELRTVLAPDLWPVNMDPTQVEQIIVNIAVNARHAMPRGGQLTFEVSNAVLDEDAVADRPETEPGEYVQLAITDTGVGMSDEVMAQIFEPFFTTREVGQGTGLGLSSVYGIVKQNHGDIWVHSQVGQGTTFKIYIPRAAWQATLSPSDRDQAADLSRGTETVLVVEDDPNVRDLIASMLRMQGYTVLEAAHAPEALRLADEHGGDLHLLLSDLVLPGMNGLELAGRLATTNPGIKVLLTSGYTRDVIERHGMPSHGIPFIEKPFSPSDMARKVRDVLDE